MRYTLLLLFVFVFVGRGKSITEENCTVSSQAMTVTLEHDLSTGFGVSWQPPVVSAACVHNYSVCVTVEGSTACENTSATWWSTRTVRPCANYSLAVEAVGAAGQQLARGVVAFFTPPSEVTNYTVTMRSSTSLLMTWAVPSNNTCVERYVLSWRETSHLGNETSLNMTTTDTSYNITDLHPCTMYAVSITGVTADNMETSQGISVYTAAEGTPLEVGELSVTLASATTISARWKQTSSCIKSYRVCVNASGDENKNCSHVADGSLQWTSSAIVKPCTEYSVAVAAMDYADQVSADRVHVFAGTAGEVSGLAVASRSADAMSITWAKPAGGEDCLQKYEVHFCTSRHAASCSAVAATASPGDEHFSASSLASCELYSAYVHSVSASGQRSYGAYLLAYTDVADQNSALANFGAGLDFNPATGDDQLVLEASWDLPDQARCLGGYQVCYKDNTANSDQACNNLAVSDVTWSTTDVHYCSNFTVQVSAVTIDGHLYPEQSTYVITPPYVVRNLTTKRVTRDTISVAWTQPPAASSSCMLGYVVHWCRSGAVGCNTDSDKASKASVNRDVMEYTLIHLHSCSTYLIWVTVTGSDGTESEAKFMYEKAGGAVPGTVSGLITPHLTCGSVYAEWDDPTTKSNCVANYELCWQGVSDENKTCKEVSFLESQYEITSLRPSTRYNVSVAAVAADGEMSEATMMQANTIAPLQVKDLSQKSKTETSISVSWKNPMENTRCTEAISVTWCNIDTQSPSKSSCEPAEKNNAKVEADAREYNITGLMPCSSYAVTVSVVSPGNVLSSSNLLRTHTVHKNPDAVEDLSLSSRTETSITVSWRNPADNAKCAREVVVSWCYEEPHSQEQGSCQPSRNNSANLPATATQFSITDLQPCSTYTVSVAVPNATDKFSSKNTDTFRTAYESPVSIDRLALQVNGSRAILTWKAVSLPKTCMEGYQVCWYSQSNSASPECSIVRTDSYVFESLPSCDVYVASVRTARPDGSFSNATNINLDFATPSEVNNLTVVNHTSDSIEVKWLPPLVNSHCVSNFEVCYGGAAGVNETCAWTSSTDNERNITGLKPGHTYNVTVRALGSTGKMSVARTVQAVTDAAGANGVSHLGSASISSVLAACGVLLLLRSMQLE